MTAENKYILTYNGKTEEIKSLLKSQNLYASINNGLRYYIGHKKVRPFAQIGIAPEFKVMADSHSSYVVSNLTNGEVEEFEYKNNIIKLLEYSISVNGGLGCIIKGSKVDYIVVADYKNSNLISGHTWQKKPDYFRLSFGVRLYGTK